MAKRKQPTPPSRTVEDKPATLKDLLSRDVLDKLKAQADEARAQQEQKLEEERSRKEEARRAEQKRLDNDFEHLLNNSQMDWHKFK
ncbi:YqkE family protein [Paenibacillus sp. JX-17]|uniref:YqkE family protein n=1 Tax=Paenibacillus lacisoli TaxID=3064525 RepID=A0ABT9CCZ6_9BACL|nr:YqkE family protein [Paenibacillus sp. JX-17]MDO7907131.1 YqkE family protein [Paenibacillus sp. JX-17]